MADIFGNIEWKDEDNVRRQIQELPHMVSKDEGYQNAMKNSDKQNARIEFERAFKNAIQGIMKDSIKLYKQINDNESLRKYLSESIFSMTYDKSATRSRQSAYFHYTMRVYVLS